jgi:hypothetical protein
MFLLQMSIQVILSSIQKSAFATWKEDSVLTDVTKGMQEEDLVQVTLECPDLDFPIRLPFMQMNQLTSELLLTEIERVLQSNEQFVLIPTPTLLGYDDFVE